MKDSGASTDISSSQQPNNLAFVIFLPKTDKQRAKARVGALPIPLRLILAAQKLHPAQIVVIGDPASKRNSRWELMSTHRLPETVQWLEAKGNTSLQEQLHVAADAITSQRVVLLDGSSTYHASVLQQASEWTDEHAVLSLANSNENIGIYSMEAHTLREVVAQGMVNACGIEDLAISIVTTHSLAFRNVPANLFQRIRTENDRLSAEAKLDQWLVKATDGMYARLNRRISIPISRQLIKLPVTANMVSIFTLGVGIASAAFFAIGGYWYTLVGALLCLFSSILDGSDGEVARLKMLESDFGCWLETVCDYAFYFFLLVGMTIGQWRSSGSKSYLLWGAFLLVGALASFLATGWERRKLAADRPDQLLKIWQAKAESRSSNPLMYAARHLEFIVRRCFFPYALVVFALLGIVKLAFIFSVIGANLVWPFVLYSTWAFTRPNRTTRASAVPALAK